MTQGSALRRRPAKLGFADGEVMVTPKDRDIFFMSARRATEACRDAIRSDEAFKRFETEVLVAVNRFCESNADRIRACYLPVPSGQIRVFIMTASPKFDFGLGEAVAALELDLSRAGWKISISQIPDADAESLAAFFNPEGALEVYAHRVAAQVQG